MQALAISPLLRNVRYHQVAPAEPPSASLRQLSASIAVADIRWTSRDTILLSGLRETPHAKSYLLGSIDRFYQLIERGLSTDQVLRNLGRREEVGAS